MKHKCPNCGCEFAEAILSERESEIVAAPGAHIAGENSSPLTGYPPIPRLSIPGNECVHCGTVVDKRLACPGCGWVDPITRRRAQADNGGDDRFSPAQRSIATD